MADYIEIDISTLSQELQKLENALHLIRKEEKQMFTAMQELNQMWEGLANTIFTQQFERDRLVFDDMCEAVENIAKSIENAIDSYRRCEVSVKDEIDRIKIT